MDNIEFTDDYRTGVETIDYEHEKLVNYLNNIINATKMGDAGRLLIEINLDELISYTGFHFKNEEALMEKFGFPDLANHKIAHEKLKKMALDYKKRFDEGHEITSDLVLFLQNWLILHIKGTDRKYIPLFKKNGVV